MEAALFFAVGIIGTAIVAFILGYSIADFTQHRRELKRLEEEDKAMEPYRGSGTSQPMDDT